MMPHPAYAPIKPGWHRLRDGSAANIGRRFGTITRWSENGKEVSNSCSQDYKSCAWLDDGRSVGCSPSRDIIGLWVPQVGEWVNVIEDSVDRRWQVVQITGDEFQCRATGVSGWFGLSKLSPAAPPAKQEPDELLSLREQLSSVERERDELRAKLAAAEQMSEERACEIFSSAIKERRAYVVSASGFESRIMSWESVRVIPKTSTATITGPASAVELVRKFAANNQCEVTG